MCDAVALLGAMAGVSLMEGPDLALGCG